MNIVIFGATSRIAECCAREWAQSASDTPTRLLLVGRQADKLDAIAQDIRLRLGSAGSVETMTADLGQLDGLPNVVNESFARIGLVDVALVAHGVLHDQSRSEHEHALALDTLVVNGLSPVLLAERVAEKMEAQGCGTLAVIGSVAGDRGRKSNYLYGAAKALVDCQLEGLRHRLWSKGVRVVTIKPGPTATPMTTGLGLPAGRMATADRVASDIVKGIERGQSVIYTPGKWRLIMFVIRHLPQIIFRRLPI